MIPRKSPARATVEPREPERVPLESHQVCAPTPPPALEPLALSARDAARACGLGLRTWRTMVATGRAPRPVRIGRRTLWPLGELREWLRAGAPPAERWEALRSRGGRP